MKIDEAIWVNVLSEKIWFKSPTTGLKVCDSVMDLILRTRACGDLNQNNFYTYWSERFPVRCIVPGGDPGFEDGYFPEKVNLYFPGIHEAIVSLNLLGETDGFASIKLEESPLTYSAEGRGRILNTPTLTDAGQVRSAISTTLSMYFEADHQGWTQPGPNELWIPPSRD